MIILGCCAKGCTNSWETPENDGIRFISSDDVYAKYGWSLDSSWDEYKDYRNWNGMIWCPDHEVAADDWIAENESS